MGIPLAELAAPRRETVPVDATQQSRWYVGLADVLGDGAGMANPQPLPREAPIKKAMFAFRENDILYGRLRPSLNKVWVADRSGICTTEFVVLRAISDASPRYLSHFLRAPSTVEALAAIQIGTSMPRVTFANLATLEVPRPTDPSEEARQLALLDAASSARQLAGKPLETLWSLLTASFVTLVDTSPFEEMQPLADYLVEIESGWSPQCLTREARTGEFGVLKVSAVSGGRFKPGENKALPPGTEVRSRLEVRRGDVLFNRANTRDLVGTAVMVPLDATQLLFSDKLWRLRPRDPNDAAYVLCALAHAQGEISDRATGTSPSMVNVPKSMLRELRVPGLPPADRGKLAVLAEGLMQLDVGYSKREALLTALYQGAATLFFPARNDAPPLVPSAETEEPREVLRFLSDRQAAIRHAASELASPFAATDLGRQLEAAGTAPFGRDEIRRAMELLVTLGALVRVSREDVEMWRVPVAEVDLVEVP